MEKENLTWEEISTEHIVQDEWIDFRKSAYRSPDGRIFQPYYSFTRRNYVVIVASDEEGQFLCVRQFRHGIREVTTEFPAGAIEQKDGEDPAEAAWLFAAENCRKTSVQELDEMERINVLKHSAEEIDAMLAGGTFPQAVHALAWLLSKQA